MGTLVGGHDTWQHGENFHPQDGQSMPRPDMTGESGYGKTLEGYGAEGMAQVHSEMGVRPDETHTRIGDVGRDAAGNPSATFMSQRNAGDPMRPTSIQGVNEGGSDYPSNEIEKQKGIRAGVISPSPGGLAPSTTHINRFEQGGRKNASDLLGS